MTIGCLSFLSMSFTSVDLWGWNGIINVFTFCELDYLVWKCTKLMNCGRGVQAFPHFQKCKYSYGWKKSMSFCFPSLPFPSPSNGLFCKWSWYKRRLRAIIAASRKHCLLYLSSKECLPRASGDHGDRGKPGYLACPPPSNRFSLCNFTLLVTAHFAA